MALEILNSDRHGACPVIICDVCKNRINLAKHGIYAHNGDDSGNEAHGPLWFAHYGKCFDTLESAFDEKGNLMGWMPVDVLPVYLSRNLGIDLLDASEKADAFA